MASEKAENCSFEETPPPLRLEGVSLELPLEWRGSARLPLPPAKPLMSDNNREAGTNDEA